MIAQAVICLNAATAGKDIFSGEIISSGEEPVTTGILIAVIASLFLCLISLIGLIFLVSFRIISTRRLKQGQQPGQSQRQQSVDSGGAIISTRSRGSPGPSYRQESEQ